LRFVEQVPVNKRRILRLLREHRLLVTAHQRLKAKRTPTGRKPEPAKPNEWWGIDMTKVLVGDFGWLAIVGVLDWYTTIMVGSYAGLQRTASHGLAALDMGHQPAVSRWRQRPGIVADERQRLSAGREGLQGDRQHVGHPPGVYQL
jgi:hypothetical protein